MNFLSFEYVLTIQRAGTIRGAAEELYISPQALSEHLGKLEREVGAPLFRRTKPLTLTEAGERFVECAETCLGAKKQLETQLTAIIRRSDGHVSLGTPMGMPPPLLLSFLDFFRHAHPELTVTAVELPTRTGAFRDIPSHIDVVMGEFRGEDGRLAYATVMDSGRFVVVVGSDLLERVSGPELARRAQEAAALGRPLSLAEFQSCPFVLKRSGSIVRDNEDRIFRAAGLAPRAAIETGDMELTVRLVLLGQAAVYLPEPVARANFLLPGAFAADRRVLLCPVQVGEGERWQLTAGWHRHRQVPNGGRALIEAARAYYQRVLPDRPGGDGEGSG